MFNVRVLFVWFCGTCGCCQLALRLFLQCAHAADRVNFSYDFFSQVLFCLLCHAHVVALCMCRGQLLGCAHCVAAAVAKLSTLLCLCVRMCVYVSVVVGQAFALAELLDSQAQVKTMGLIIASLRVANGCNEEGYDNLITRCAPAPCWGRSLCAVCCALLAVRPA
jgi:hypothetical protein